MIRLLQAMGLLFLLSEPPPLRAANQSVQGKVENSKGLAIEHARVSDTASENEAFTDRSGRFELPCELPCTLIVSHPRFNETPLTVTDASADSTVRLIAKQEVYEEIVITASRGGETFAPVSISSTVINPEEAAAAPSTLVELVEGVAGVAENGQAGIFQTYSIRGVARQRVMTLVDGMRIVGERRAGVSASFIDPLLMGSVDVLRGPASTYYGSGALGGVLQVFPTDFDGPSLRAGFSEAGNETYQVLGWGDENWSLGFAHRHRENAETPDGLELNDHFTQYSAVLSRTWQHNNFTWNAVVMPSLSDDIGKSNTDFPLRNATYPEERHLLVKVGATSDKGWSFDVWAHPNDLITEVDDFRQNPGDRSTFRRSTVENKAFDLGASFLRNFDLGNREVGKNVAGRFGIDYFGRRGVEAEEFGEVVINGQSNGARPLAKTLDGQENEVAAFGSLNWDWGPTKIQTAARLTLQQQENNGLDTLETDDSAFTGFIGISQPLGKGWELAATLGTGLRFPSLSERFFTGATGRGQVLGNPNLEPERSVNLDLGLRYYGSRLFWSTQIFHLDVDDYIERVNVDPAGNFRTFVNLGGGEIEGVEIEGFLELTERWRLSWNGHLLSGESDNGANLSDIPPDRVQLGLRFQEKAWTSQLTYQLRDSKDDPGPGENAIPAAHLVHVSLDYQVNDELRVTVRGRNLLDEEFFSSADDRAPPAAGRSLGIGLVWEP